MVGSAIVRRLARENCEVLTAERETVDLRDQVATRAWIANAKPDAIFLAAAKVGGILANDTYPADFLYDNLDDRGEYHRGRLSREGGEAAVPGIVLYLSENWRRSRYRKRRC